MTDAVPVDRFRQLVADKSIPVVHRTLWMLLWEGELRLNDLLSLDVRDVDLEGRTAPVDFPKTERNPHRAPFSEEAARMLRDLIGDRADGPLFALDPDKPAPREHVIRAARRVGEDIHGFRLGGQRSGSQPAPSSPSSQA